MKRRTFVVIGAILLEIYWYLVVSITGGTPTNFLIIRDFSVSANVSLVPFADVLSILRANGGAGNYLQIGGNILLFMPLGFLLPFFWQGWRNAKLVVGFGIAMSLFIELNQMFNSRATSIDDLILNTIGAAIGFVCYLVAKRRLGLQPRAGACAEKLPIYLLFAVWGFKIITELPMYLEWMNV